MTTIHINHPLGDDSGDSVITRCPDCGQLEVWDERETQDHGLCRAQLGPCEVCGKAAS